MLLATRIGAFSALGFCACTLIYGPSDADFAGGSRDGGVAADSATSGGSPGEGGVVAASDSGTDAGSFVCPAGALVCDDFESLANPFAKTGGAFATVAGGPPGSSHALECTLESSETSYPFIESTLTPANAAGTLSFWFKPSAAAPDSNDHFRIASALWGNACDWQLTWTAYLAADGLFFDLDYYNQQTQPNCGPLRFDVHQLLTASQVYDGGWHHVVAVMDAQTATVTATVTIDDEAPSTLSEVTNRSVPPAKVQLDFGVPCIQTNSGCFDWTGSPWKIGFDQIAFTPQSP